MPGNRRASLLCGVILAAGNGQEAVREWSALSSVRRRESQCPPAHTTSITQDLPLHWAAHLDLPWGFPTFSHQLSLSFGRLLLYWQADIFVGTHKCEFSNLLAFPCEQWQRTQEQPVLHKGRPLCIMCLPDGCHFFIPPWYLVVCYNDDNLHDLKSCKILKMARLPMLYSRKYICWVFLLEIFQCNFLKFWTHYLKICCSSKCWFLSIF